MCIFFCFFQCVSNKGVGALLWHVPAAKGCPFAAEGVSVFVLNCLRLDINR